MAEDVVLGGTGVALSLDTPQTEPQPQVAELLRPTPFVLGVLADFAGRSTAAGELTARCFHAVDRESLDARLHAWQPRVTFQVPDQLAGQGDLLIDLHFHHLNDFAPAAVAVHLAPLAGLLTFRQQLMISATADMGVATVQVLEALARGPQWAAVARAATTAASAGMAAPARRDAVVAALDGALSAQLSQVIQHPEFRALEQTWLGLQGLVQHAAEGAAVQVVVLHLAQAEILTLAQASLGQPTNASWLAQAVRAAAERLGGAPVRCLVGGYAFAHDLADVAALVYLSQVAASTGSVFVASASPRLLGLAAWHEFTADTPPPVVASGEAFAAWRLLRGIEEAAHLALVLPAALVRLPYGPRGQPVADFAFTETAGPGEGEGYAWGHASYLLAQAIVQVVAAGAGDDWRAALAQGVTLRGLPCLALPPAMAGAAPHLVGPLAVTLPRVCDTWWADLGLTPLRQWPYSAAVLLDGLRPLAEETDPAAS